jgi:hypothetical protein
MTPSQIEKALAATKIEQEIVRTEKIGKRESISAKTERKT